MLMVKESFVTYLLDVNGKRILCDIFIGCKYFVKLMVKESFVTYLLDVNRERILCDIFIGC